MTNDSDPPKRRVLILGGGFAGAHTAVHLERQLRDVPDVEITLVAKENFVLFTPMLHEIAGADLSVTDIVQPLRKMLRRTRVGIADVESIDLKNKVVRVLHSGTAKERELTYDHLVLAMGAVTNFRGIPGLAEHALTMKSLGDAIVVRNHALDALNVADNQADEEDRKKTLTVVIAGGGFAGTETAGALNDLFLGTVKFYPQLRKGLARVVLVHPGDCLLPELSPSLGRYAEKKLATRGVEVILNRRVTGYDGREVSLDDGTKIATRTLVWTAGITPSPLISTLPCTQRGRVLANEYMQVPEWPGVWALGDCALVPDPAKAGTFYPPTAQHAIREAKVLAQNIAASLRGGELRPFKFKIIGQLAAIGRRSGVAEIYGFKFSGYIAWFLWRTIYLAKLPGFQNKVRVAIDWTLYQIFSKNIVQLPTLQAPTISESEAPRTTTSSIPAPHATNTADTDVVKAQG
jgi:NADH:ubiquinone reductase (H+-translocating)